MTLAKGERFDTYVKNLDFTGFFAKAILQIRHLRRLRVHQSQTCIIPYP